MLPTKNPEGPYFIDKIYVFDDDLVITGDFVDYVGHDRYNREHYWSFNGFDTDYSSSKVFDLTELSSTCVRKVELGFLPGPEFALRVWME